MGVFIYVRRAIFSMSAPVSAPAPPKIKNSNQAHILEAMFYLKARKGISHRAIKKYVTANFGEIKALSPFRTSMKKLLTSGALEQKSSGRFVLSVEKRKEMVNAKKPKKPKKPKKVVTRKRKRP